MPQEAPPLSRPAAAYQLSVLAAATGAAATLVALSHPARDSWWLVALLAGGAAATRLQSPSRPHGRSIETTAAALVAAELLVAPAGLLLVVLASFAPRWRRLRSQPRQELFRLGVHALAALAGRTAFAALGSPAATGAAFAAAGLAACAATVAVDVGLRAGTRGPSLLRPEAVATALWIAGIGVAAAALWRADPWVLPFAVVPLLLVQRALAVPRLQQESALDPKTGLYNVRRFTETLTEELARAERQGRPLSVLMVDLDLLREVNNTHGHLAGDAVLVAVATAIRDSVREEDLAARFGGEEFGVLLPGAGRADALEIARRIRRAVEETEVAVETSPVPLRATVSVGVACYPVDAADPRSLVHAADVGLYRAKNEGRNRVVYAGEPATV